MISGEEVYNMNDEHWFEDMEARIPKGEVRTRFAPSPTGYMHVGNLRTALYTWLIARHAGGKFILRIEDTDQSRLVEGAVDVIYKTMTQCGLSHDEGPDVGGPVGPYVQTERRGLYREYAEKLMERGHAYRCFCERTESEEDAGDFARAEDPCRSLSREKSDRRAAAGEPYVIRQLIPGDGTTTFHDEIFGDITVENAALDDQVLLKRDGLPTYNFANVVDDHLMGITHVVRGSEYLSSAPKYNLLYEGFGWEIPKYIHCSPVMRDAHNKMSKRHGDPSYEDLIAQGYVTEAVVNYVALLGWSPGGEREIYSLDELKDVFDISGISKSPAIFDIEKLRYFNAEYIRAMTPEQFAAVAEPFIRQAVKNPAIDPAGIAPLLQQRTEVLTEIPEKLDFFDTLPDYSPELFVHQKSKTSEESCLEVLKQIIPAFETVADWKDENILKAMTDLVAKLGCKNAFVMWPVRIAAAGKAVTPGGAAEICRILGKDETLRRLNIGVEKLSK
jgi:glutamyl-tRNA synthetase